MLEAMSAPIAPAPAALALSLAVVAGCEAEAVRGRVEVVVAPPGGEVPPWVHEQVQAAAGRDVIVYVGATWCEPCRHFHDAVTGGRLDVLFPRLTLLEFDLDRDEDRLTRAGYLSQMIPLFARPAPDGTASGGWIEGSIKGEGAVVELTPRLHALLRAPLRAPRRAP
jgi:thiol-disulfide isomerase/thioredoxin